MFARCEVFYIYTDLCPVVGTVNPVAIVVTYDGTKAIGTYNSLTEGSPRDGCCTP